MSIRFARKADCAAIAEIYNHAVLYTAAIWLSLIHISEPTRP